MSKKEFFIPLCLLVLLVLIPRAFAEEGSYIEQVVEKWQPMDLAEPEYTVEDTTELLKRLRETPLPYQVIQKNEKIIEI